MTVTDISPVQLALNERHVREAGCEDAVERRFPLDVRDLHVPELDWDSFDAVVVYGGPLSYVFEEADIAFHQLVRVVQPEGFVLASVMSTVGSFRYFLPQALAEREKYGGAVYDHLMATGDLRAIPGSHTCQMYTWNGIEALVAGVHGEIVAASASNCLSLGDPALIAGIEADAERWAWFVDWEARMCREPGALDGGTHILFAFRKSPAPKRTVRERFGRDPSVWRNAR